MSYKKFHGGEITNPLQTYYRDVFIELSREVFEESGETIPENNPLGNFTFDNFSNVSQQDQQFAPVMHKDIPVVFHLVRGSTDPSDDKYESNYQNLSNEQIDYLFNLINLLRPQAEYSNDYIKFSKATTNSSGELLDRAGFNLIEGSDLRRVVQISSSLDDTAELFYNEYGVAIRESNKYTQEASFYSEKVKGILPSQIANITLNKFPTDQYLNIYIVNALRTPVESNLVKESFVEGITSTETSCAQSPLVIPPLYGEMFGCEQSCGIYISYEQLSKLKGNSSSNISKFKNWIPTRVTFGKTLTPFFNSNINDFPSVFSDSDDYKNGVQILKALASYIGLRDPGFYNIVRQGVEFYINSPKSGSDILDCTLKKNYGDGIPDTQTKPSEVFNNVTNTTLIFDQCRTGTENLTAAQGSSFTNILYITKASESEHSLVCSFTPLQLIYSDFNFHYIINNNFSLLTRLVGNDSNPIYFTFGCTNPGYDNYNPDATVNDGSCFSDSIISGCMDLNYLEYNPAATQDDGSCLTEIIYGCVYDLQNATASIINYNPDATHDDGSCIIWYKGCTNPLYEEYNSEAMIDNGSCKILIDTSNVTYLTSDDGGCNYYNPTRSTQAIRNILQNNAKPRSINNSYNLSATESFRQSRSFFKLKTSINNLAKTINYGD
tara:strand:+ start:2291 stop:4282 length:1992 start_codon:yes stop_codon:yes gene_type:complete